MKHYTTILPAYDVSGGDTNFDTIAFEGNNFLGVQIYYTSLNQADHKIKLRESLDGVDFLDSEDSSGNAIEITLNNAVTSDIMKVYNFNTTYVGFSFVEGTTGTGTIDKLKIITE
jgi:hypothetical protein